MKTKLNTKLFAAFLVATLLVVGILESGVDARSATFTATKSKPASNAALSSEDKVVAEKFVAKDAPKLNKSKKQQKQQKACSNKGDLNNDGKKDFFDIDLLRFTARYNAFVQSNHHAMFARGDFDSDNDVDEDDVEAFFKAPGKVCRADFTLAKKEKARIEQESAQAVGNGLKGDVNLDGTVDFFDIDYFNMVLQNSWFMETHHPAMYHNADMDDSGEVTDPEDTSLLLKTLFN